MVCPHSINVIFLLDISDYNEVRYYVNLGVEEAVATSETTASPATTVQQTVKTTAAPPLATTEGPKTTSQVETTQGPVTTAQPETTVGPETTAVSETTAGPGIFMIFCCLFGYCPPSGP